MPDFPHYAKATAFGSTYVSAGWATHVMIQLSIAQSLIRQCMGQFTTLASFLHIGQNTNGYVSIFYHSNLGGVTPSNHHNWQHASKHRVGGSDALPLASAGGWGLLGSADFIKVNAMAASATRNQRIASKYIGDGNSTQLISIGFQPFYVKIMQSGSIGHVYDQLKGHTKTLRHHYGSTHFYPLSASFIATHANGFDVLASCNTLSVVYYFWASRRD